MSDYIQLSQNEEYVYADNSYTDSGGAAILGDGASITTSDFDAISLGLSTVDNAVNTLESSYYNSLTTLNDVTSHAIKESGAVAEASLYESLQFGSDVVDQLSDFGRAAFNANDEALFIVADNAQQNHGLFENVLNTITGNHETVLGANQENYQHLFNAVENANTTEQKQAFDTFTKFALYALVAIVAGGVLFTWGKK